MTPPTPEYSTSPSLRTWFDAALQQPAPERTRWLAANCPDATLREAVGELLNAHGSDDAPWAHPIGDWFLAMDDETLPADAMPEAIIGRTIADYRLLRQIGSGGMATVFLAERQHADFEQRVAIKILRHNVLSASELRMFRRERQLLAALDHPNIARLIDGGVTAQGLPYLVLEYVDGVPITQYCRDQRTSLRERVRLAGDVCRAVEHAHRAMIVHRDIKPANVLVTAEGVVKLLDFGVAKLLQADNYRTQTVDAFMTPEYAAPEQVRRGGDSPALDVYALGVVLHELILGVRPERHSPMRPSRLITPSTATVADPSTLRRFLAGDLDNILERALQPDPLLRYRNAGELADDLQRFLDGDPVLAHPPSTWYRTKKFVLRHRGAVGVSAVLVVAVLASLGLAAWQGVEARRQAEQAEQARARAETEADRANAVVRYVLGLFDAAQEVAPERDRLSPTQLLDVAEQTLVRDATLPPLTQARLWESLARISDSLSRFDRAQGQFRKALDLLAPLRGREADDARTGVTVGLAQSLLRTGLARDARTLLDARVDANAIADPGLRYQARQILTEVAFELGEPDQALAQARAAASDGALAFATDSRDRLFADLLPARTLALLGRHTDALPLLQQGRARWLQLGLPPDIEFVNLESAIAVGLFQTGEPDAGLAMIDQAIVDVRAIHGGPSVSEVGLLENAASMRFSRGWVAPALDQVGRAIAAAREIYPAGSAALISLELTAATFAARGAPPDAAIGRYEAVKTMCAAHPNASKLGDCGRVHSNLANLLTRLDRLDDAARELDLADTHQRALYGEHSVEVGSVAVSRGNVFARRGQWPAALVAYDLALRNYERAGLNDQRRGRLLLGRAQAQYALQQIDAAQGSILAASDNLDRYLANDHRTRAEAKAWLAIIMAANAQADTAAQAAREARALDPDIARRLTTPGQAAFRKLAP
ncbi:MAG: serine/threonine protein kinase [Rhodanobacteraceae bacterium]|nr:serine/threonine protein kinase [Rhodanobacteraceae bacterium]